MLLKETIDHLFKGKAKASDPPKVEEVEPAIDPPDQDTAHPPIDEQKKLADEATTLHRAGRVREAAIVYAKILRQDPFNTQVCNNLGVLLKSLNKFKTAIALYQRLVKLDPKAAGAYSNMGNAYRSIGMLDESLLSHRQAVALEPLNAHYRYNLGLALKDMGYLDEALECLEWAIKHDPNNVNFHWDYALVLLMKGDYVKGWKEYEWRWKLPEAQKRLFTASLWQGESLEDKTIFVYAEQGFGDTIHFARYLNLLKKQAHSIIFECPAPLVPLLQNCPAIDHIVAAGDVIPDHDYQVPLLNLPHLLGTTIETIPSQVPYVEIPPGYTCTALDFVKKPTGAKLKVGIAWAGRPTQKNDYNRSCPFTEFISLLDIPEITFYSLQKGEREKDLLDSGAWVLVPNIGGIIENFADTAAVIEELDLVISVDSAPSHLAGALAKPVWTLLSYSACWRYLSGCDETPWYPTMRLFRQDKPGDWGSVFKKVRQELLMLY